MIERVPHSSNPSDVMYLLERLEDLLAASSGVPFFTRKRLVDDEACLAVIEQIKLALPHEIRQARRINMERESVLEEAHARANQMLRAAEADAEERVKEHPIAKRAEARSQEIITNAERRSAQLRREADEYVYSALADLERRVQSLLETTRAGLLDLEGRQPTVPSEDLEDELLP